MSDSGGLSTGLRSWGYRLHADEPNQLALFGLNAFSWQSTFPLKNLIDNPFLFGIVDEKRDPAGGIDQRVGKSNSMVVELRNEIAYHLPFALRSRRSTLKQRSRD